jgi:hypothetical protein
MKDNKVGSMSEQKFREHWLQLLWMAMAKTGRGFRKQSLRHSGKGDDRRKDKLITTKLTRRLARQAPGRFAYVQAVQ